MTVVAPTDTRHFRYSHINHMCLVKDRLYSECTCLPETDHYVCVSKLVLDPRKKESNLGLGCCVSAFYLPKNVYLIYSAAGEVVYCKLEELKGERCVLETGVTDVLMKEHYSLPLPLHLRLPTVDLPSKQEVRCPSVGLDSALEPCRCKKLPLWYLNCQDDVTLEGKLYRRVPCNLGKLMPCNFSDDGFDQVQLFFQGPTYNKKVTIYVEEYIGFVDDYNRVIS